MPVRYEGGSSFLRNLCAAWQPDTKNTCTSSCWLNARPPAELQHYKDLPQLLHHLYLQLEELQAVGAPPRPLRHVELRAVVRLLGLYNSWASSYSRYSRKRCLTQRI